MRIGWLWLARISCASVALAVISCSVMRTTYTEDGRRGYALSCKGFFNSWDTCLVKAGRICGPLGYDTLRSDEYDRQLLITCKSPQAR